MAGNELLQRIDVLIWVMNISRIRTRSRLDSLGRHTELSPPSKLQYLLDIWMELGNKVYLCGKKLWRRRLLLWRVLSFVETRLLTRNAEGGSKAEHKPSLGFQPASISSSHDQASWRWRDWARGYSKNSGFHGCLLEGKEVVGPQDHNNSDGKLNMGRRVSGPPRRTGQGEAGKRKSGWRIVSKLGDLPLFCVSFWNSVVKWNAAE